MMGHHGVKVELQDVDVGGFLVVGTRCFPLWGKEFWLVLGRTKKRGDIRCEKFRTV